MRYTILDLYVIQILLIQLTKSEDYFLQGLEKHLFSFKYTLIIEYYNGICSVKFTLIENKLKIPGFGFFNPKEDYVVEIDTRGMHPSVIDRLRKTASEIT